MTRYLQETYFYHSKEKNFIYIKMDKENYIRSFLCCIEWVELREHCKEFLETAENILRTVFAEFYHKNYVRVIWSFKTIL